MPAYCLFQNIEITDPDAMAEYVERVAPVTAGFGGRYVVSAGAVEVKEGDWRPHPPVLIEFPDLAAANAWYDSPEYRPLKELRESAGRFSAVFLEGIPG